jgi:hypothetical protein
MWHICIGVYSYNNIKEKIHQWKMEIKRLEIKRLDFMTRERLTYKADLIVASEMIIGDERKKE